GGEVDGDAVGRKLEAAVSDGRADAVAALADGGIRQAYRRERGEARGDVHFHRYRRHLDPMKRRREDPSQHGASLKTSVGGVNDSRAIQGLREPTGDCSLIAESRSW